MRCTWPTIRSLFASTAIVLAVATAIPAARAADPFEKAPAPGPSDPFRSAPGASMPKPAAHPRRPSPVPDAAPAAPATATLPAPTSALDGVYYGTVTSVAPFGGGGHHNCRSGSAVQMRITGSAVHIMQAQPDGQTVGYDGAVDGRGAVTASHTGYDGFTLTALGSITGNRFAGRLVRRGCQFTVDLERQ